MSDLEDGSKIFCILRAFIFAQCGEILCFHSFIAPELYSLLLHENQFFV